MSVSPAALPAYSVLLPLAPWESPPVLREALASLVAQGLPPAQVVVSCDGPPPEALALELERAELPMDLVLGPGGEGLGPVLARGLLACREELVLRFDADDLCLHDRALWQVQAMVRRPELAALSAPLAEFQVDPQQASGCRTVPRGAHRLRRFSRWRNPLNHPAVILRRSRVLAAGNYRARSGFEDYDLWLRLLRRGDSLDNLAEPVVLARVGPAHLGRRQGWGYARREVAFLWACGREGLLPWAQVVLLLVLRPPLRMLPAAGLGWLMAALLRRSASRS
ncbi:glycosyltransferase [Vulcanococcus limneticus Candia 3F8]|uniref:glycosyltransferase n=1 Tax=Vulcanococcus limneticus TaxID=2170428 RepID=UPI000B98D93C|nr:glycosyltransferase [Vulcanococcus limneticus]MCP9792484.1 glycosyltransferase [Vulcanococcus limneticus MW73D5]MCP9894165.1 glycosyltransferase [Vulcanococcus limneticus Candia 3F8]MCP9897792.1 glycosyltransferase [Vulcanococcus limneticus Candia 3B3]